ncbi:MAG: hypothetical protein IPN77_16920 [Sandaracinaceae bacterium]|nr:hypothetical protein [Sandaracinaceae bacterium]
MSCRSTRCSSKTRSGAGHPRRSGCTTVRVLHRCSVPRPDPVPGEVTLRDLDVFIAERFVVTHHEGNVSAVPHVRQMVERFPDLLAQGPAVVAHRIVDFMVDRFMIRMNTLGERVDGLELAALRATTPAVLETILEAKHDVLHLGRLVRHQKEVLRALATARCASCPRTSAPSFATSTTTS